MKAGRSGVGILPIDLTLFSGCEGFVLVANCGGTPQMSPTASTQIPDRPLIPRAMRPLGHSCFPNEGGPINTPPKIPLPEPIFGPSNTGEGNSLSFWLAVATPQNK